MADRVPPSESVGVKQIYIYIHLKPFRGDVTPYQGNPPGRVRNSL